jgi:hypothetical protein
MAVLGFAGLGAVESLRSSGAAADVIVETPERFGWAILALSVVAVLDIVVAWGLWRVFRGEQPGGAALAAAFRIAYAAAFVGAIAQLDHAVRIATGADDAGVDAVRTAAVVDQQVQGFDAAWSGALVLFAAHLVVIGWLLMRRSGVVATVLGVLVAVAGLGYAADSVIRILAPDLGIGVAVFTFVGEVLLIGWLAAGGIRARRSGDWRPGVRGTPTRPALATASEGA